MRYNWYTYDSYVTIVVDNNTTRYRVAQLAVHTGIAPSEFINMDSTMLRAIQEVLLFYLYQNVLLEE